MHKLSYILYQNPQNLVLFSFSSGFETCDVLHGKVVSSSPNTQPEGPGLHIHVPGDKATQLHP
jgi:hypothetical protein